MTNLGKKLEGLEGKLLVWLSAAYAVISIVGEIFKIPQFQSFFKKPEIFVPALSFFLFLVSKYILSLSEKLDYINNVSQHLNKIKEDVTFLRSKNEISTLDSYWNFCLSLAEKGVYEQESSDTITIEKGHAPKFWRRMLIRPEISWFCTDVVKPDEKWGYGWDQNTALGFQRYALEEGASVRRIFIVTDEKLLNSHRTEIKEMMQAHEKVGVGVKWIAPSSSSSWINLSKFEEKLGTIDFAIADKKYITAFHLDKNLRHMKFCLIKNEKLAKDLYDLYETLWLTSDPLHELDYQIINKT